ncbi:PsiF family protein [Mitsuaria sp. GD03876]|uniref:PsiF family protein n=1 Tax=Mitsuaria sp. GD03876 TaxID=2975399 RepID=UPI0024493468|nr:PsiF family protein [Mitsuaria sp. GD03876]MDH0865550.1 PsiF family protein [Mitsuaria sp. GD03876]
MTRLTPISLIAGAMLALASLGAHAADEAKKAPTAQQQRMKTCNADAKGKSGDERKAFMSSCLKGETAAASAPAMTEQQTKMKTCNADYKASGKSGKAEHDKFMKACLSAK